MRRQQGWVAAGGLTMMPVPRLQIKAWAKAHGLNDASKGSFNSWSLTLMVRGRDARASSAAGIPDAT